ncbi:MAG TPA: hypothetical protein DCL73_03975, partial [Treponema sp.]|nr:hypothetical protein [Treponema sp.]
LFLFNSGRFLKQVQVLKRSERAKRKGATDGAGSERSRPGANGQEVPERKAKPASGGEKSGLNNLAFFV